MKKYRVTTFLTLFGKKELVELPDSSYGEWVVYENGFPKYYINCFNSYSESNQIILRLLSDKAESIQSILNKINRKKGLKLYLEDIPANWIKEIK